MLYKIGDLVARPHSPTDPAAGLVFLAVLVLPRIFYLVSMHRALSRCSPSGRSLTPGLVWLGLVPMLSLIWDFVVVVTVSKSVGDELVARRKALPTGYPGLGAGIAFCVLNMFFWIPFLNIFSMVASLVLWIVFWVKIAGLSSELA